MSWPKRILIGLGLVLALLIVLVLIISYWTPGGPATQAISMTVGDRTLTIAGHYATTRQDSLPEGLRVAVDKHQITIENDQLTVDGQTRVLEPGHDVVAWVHKDGRLEVKLVRADAAGATPPAEAP